MLKIIYVVKFFFFLLSIRHGVHCIQHNIGGGRGEAIVQTVYYWLSFHCGGPGFSPRAVHLGFMAGKLALGREFGKVLLFSSVTFQASSAPYLRCPASDMGM